jgi:copper chaperone CopZ
MPNIQLIEHNQSAISHHLPHRTRIRVPRRHRQLPTMNKIQDRLIKVPGVQSVEVNERTGSVLVHHDVSDDTFDKLSSAISEVASEVFTEALDAELPGVSRLASYLGSKVRGVNNSIAQSTDSQIDLHSAIPLFLLGASVVKFVREKSWWGDIPAFVLFYYAWDSFLKLNPQAVPGAYDAAPLSDSQTSDGELPRRRRKEAK